MDPRLLKERDAFKKRAAAQPTIEKKKFSRPVVDPAYREESSSFKKHKPGAAREDGPKFDYKTASKGTSSTLMLLQKVVKYMRGRHQQGEDYSLSIEEIFDEMKEYNVKPNLRNWLIAEALPNNPKIITDRDGKFSYRPSFDIKDKRGLIQLLQQHSLNGLGGIKMDDIEESLAHAKQVMEEIKDKVIIIKADKNTMVVFYKDPAVATDIPEDICKLWRSINVEGMDEKKIADYLEHHNFSFIKSEQKRPVMGKKRGRKSGVRDGKFVPKHNEHVADILQDYSSKVKH